jgi:hypothetical protein
MVNAKLVFFKVNVIVLCSMRTKIHRERQVGLNLDKFITFLDMWLLVL